MVDPDAPHLYRIAARMLCAAAVRRGDRLWLNAAARSLLGRPHEPTTTVAAWRAAMDPDSDVVAVWEKARDSSAAITLRGADGERRRVRLSVVPEGDAELWLLDDEAAVAQRDEAWRVLFQEAPEPHMIVGRGGFVDVNDALVARLGAASREELLRRRPAEFAPETQPDGRSSREAAIAFEARIRAHGRATERMVHRRVDGTPVLVDVFASSLTTAHGEVVHGVWRDLTDVHRQHALAAAASRVLRRLLDAHANVGAALADVLALVAETLPGAALSLSLERDVFDDDAITLEVHQGAAPDGAVYALGVTLGERAVGVLRVRRAHLDEHETLFLTAVADAFSASATLVAYARALRGARDVAERAMRARSDFLATMSHEIRTPLNGVLGMVAMLADTTLDAEQGRYVEILRTSSEALLALLDDVLDLARAESGRDAPALGPVDVRALCDEVLALSSARCVARGLSLALDWPEGVTPMRVTDSARVRQVLTNLVGNAVKFTLAGGVTLAVRERDREDDRAVLSFEVRDTGIGIARDKLAHIFEPFTQADASTTRRFGGTGLGLAISRTIAELLGATLTVESVVGHGSTFCLALPLQDAPPQPRAPSPRPTSRPAPVELHALLVEDNPTNRLVAQHLLRKLGVTVESVEDGRTALARASLGGLDVIFMDCHMPGMDGYDTARAVRALPGEHGAVPIVAMTASALPGDRERCLAAGMNAYVSKPISLDRVRDALVEVGLAEPRDGETTPPAR